MECILCRIKMSHLIPTYSPFDCFEDHHLCRTCYLSTDGKCEICRRISQFTSTIKWGELMLKALGTTLFTPTTWVKGVEGENEKADGEPKDNVGGINNVGLIGCVDGTSSVDGTSCLDGISGVDGTSFIDVTSSVEGKSSNYSTKCTNADVNEGGDTASSACHSASCDSDTSSCNNVTMSSAIGKPKDSYEVPLPIKVETLPVFSEGPPPKTVNITSKIPRYYRKPPIAKDNELRSCIPVPIPTAKTGQLGKEQGKPPGHLSAATATKNDIPKKPSRIPRLLRRTPKNNNSF